MRQSQKRGEQEEVPLEAPVTRAVLFCSLHGKTSITVFHPSRERGEIADRGKEMEDIARAASMFCERKSGCRSMREIAASNW